MTKKIAVVGCSFSAFWQGDQQQKGANYNVKTWSHHLVENFDVTIDSFAQNGTSPGYFNFCLNWINNNPDLEYDLIIGAMPPLNRDWYFGFNDADEEKDYKGLLKTSSWFESKEITERVKLYNVSNTMITHSHNNLSYIQGQASEKLHKESNDYLQKFTNHTKNNYLINHKKNLEYVQVAREYYTKILPFQFWYHLPNHFTHPEPVYIDNKVDYAYISRHSIMHEKNVFEYFKKYHKEFLIDDTHFNTLGHQHLLEKYILTDNKIGSIIIE
tara:strand:+ start:1335 stop:2147 length:813 start_codon:yes stop_codon:yes gene_type:complete